MGCSERASIAPASAISASPSPSTAIASVTVGRPNVSVPVLSNANVTLLPSVSSAPPPLNSTPPRAAAASADNTAAGTLITTAHGLAATSSVAVV
jgi:hypothetical protein